MAEDSSLTNTYPAILVGLRTDESDDEFEHSMEELESLAEACDLSVRSTLTQTLPHPENATWIGSGKADELKYLVRGTGADYAVCLGNLTPNQMKNLQKIIEIEVWDRTRLILEIFSRRARTREAKLQVESAYLQYMLPRLSGMWQHLGRQSGGGGSRANKGIGEKQIELDRRQISKRLAELRRELGEIERTRNVQRSGRLNNSLINVALVGYTNAGKSSLMNRLLSMCESSSDAASDKKVFEKDMLFATLDTSIRKIDIPGRRPFLLSDTVGFIEDIPHSLIKAFRSTLSEVKFSDILLIVMDSSDPHHKDHKRVTEEVLRDLDSDSIPRIYVYNKSDLRDSIPRPVSDSEENAVYISTRTGYGIEELLDKLFELLSHESQSIDVIIPYTDGEIISRIHSEGVNISEEYEEAGTHISAVVPAPLAGYINSKYTPSESL